ncbi:MAG: LLM class flavin-dependent oxidoreductase [Hyphomicrobiaceae bacterium]|nr:LLM class flavin-dependent oxidoreductase [Hyphomicrobiaceae bacterium]
MNKLEFGWFIPTRGDTDDYGEPLKIPAGPEMFERVAVAAEKAGFEYLLIPVGHQCWDAWMTGAIMAGKTKHIRMLIAARPSYINPVLQAKMIATFDQLTKGRICINLIAGQSESENIAEGVKWSKQERYEIMEEEVSILKALWSQGGGLTDWNGKYYTLKQAELNPKPYQQPYPKFYLGGGSAQASEISAKHSDIHLFWGDTYERIRDNMKLMRELAKKYGREDKLGFGMRLQIICRENEKDAWEVADGLIRNVTKDREDYIRSYYAQSEANQRVQQLAREKGDLIEENLWSGLTKARPGAGICIVGNPEQCANVIQNYIDIGCKSFCLSGYLHDAEAERFHRMVRPILEDRNRGRMKAA